MKQFNFIGQIVAILFALVLVTSATPVDARPDSGLQLGMPKIEPVTVVQLAQPLMVGANGEQVRQLQVNLKKLGYFPATVAATGYYGPITAKAVGDFQIARGLTVSSIVDNTTWTKVSQTVNPPSSSCRADFNGDGDVDTRDIATFLNAWAALDQSADIDGNGLVDSDDFKAFITLWNEGCQEGAEETTSPCDISDFNNDEVVNSLDITAYLNAWAAKDISADMNGDGAVEIGDFTSFMDLWKQCTL